MTDYFDNDLNTPFPNSFDFINLSDENITLFKEKIKEQPVGTLELEKTKKKSWQTSSDYAPNSFSVSIYTDILNVLVHSKLELNSFNYQAETTKEKRIEIEKAISFYTDLTVDIMLQNYKKSKLSIEPVNLFTQFINIVYQLNDEKKVIEIIDKLEQSGVNVYQEKFVERENILYANFTKALQQNYLNLAIKFYQNWTEDDKKEKFKKQNLDYILIFHSRKKINAQLLPQIKTIVEEILKYCPIKDELKLHKGTNAYGDSHKKIYPLEELVLFSNENTANQAMFEIMVEKNYSYMHELKKNKARDRKSLVHYLVKRPNFGYTKILLDNHPEWLNYTTFNGKNLLHLSGCKKTIDYLLAHGVDPEKRDNLGILPVVEILAHGIFDKKKPLRDWATNYIKKHNISLSEQYLNHTVTSLMQSRKLLIKKFKEIVDERKSEIKLSHYLSNVKDNYQVISEKINNITSEQVNEVDEHGKTLGHVLWSKKKSSRYFYNYKNYLFYTLINKGFDINKTSSIYNINQKKEELSSFALWLNYEHFQYVNTHNVTLDHKLVENYKKKIVYTPVDQEKLYQTIFASYNWNKLPGWNESCSQKVAQILFENLGQENDLMKQYLKPYIQQIPKEIKGQILYFALKSGNHFNLKKYYPELIMESHFTTNFKRRMTQLHKRKSFGSEAIKEVLDIVESQMLKEFFTIEQKKSLKSNKIL